MKLAHIAHGAKKVSDSRMNDQKTKTKWNTRTSLDHILGVIKPHPTQWAPASSSPAIVIAEAAREDFLMLSSESNILQYRLSKIFHNIV